ncbi:S8 family serine peptidase [Kitasatospora sp. NPDC057198]|uniref:S8 family serine peptidase n=1 Tax=Kitasatospora sp. NPDC057198 TaxID=3346046 RepID=UPI00363A9B3D
MRRALAGTLLPALLLTFAGAPTASADQVRDGQWVNAYFGMDRVWSVSKGDGVIVAVIDSGVDATHPDLAGSVLPGYDPGGQGLNTHPTDDHGTSISGIIAAHGHGSGDGIVGIAPGARILPVYKGNPDAVSAVPEGIKWAVDHGAKVINLSLGTSAQAGSRPDLTGAVAYAAEHDVLIVGAAGNESLKTVDSPGNEPGVLAVSAVDRTGAVWPRANSGAEVKISAPGADIVNACADGKYCIGDGTSEATAYVSGAAALVRAKFPDLTAGQVAERLVKSAKVPGALQGAKLPDPRYGYGILSPYDALTADIPAGPPQGPLGGPYAKASSGGEVTPAATPSAGTAPKGGGAGAASAGSGLHEMAKDDGPGAGLLVVAGGGAVLLLLLVLLVVVLVSRSRRRARFAPPAPGPYPPGQGWPPVQQQPPYYGPPQQQTPYQQPHQGGGWQ